MIVYLKKNQLTVSFSLLTLAPLNKTFRPTIFACLLELSGVKTIKFLATTYFKCVLILEM
jgi:hypothetical protein